MTPDTQDAQTFREIYAAFFQNRQRSATAAEWSEFEKQALEKMTPVVNRLERSATSQNPRRWVLLFAGRDYLKRLVTEERFRQLELKPEPMTDDCEQRFRQNMATFDGNVLASTAMLTPAQGEGPMLNPLFGDPSRKL